MKRQKRYMFEVHCRTLDGSRASIRSLPGRRPLRSTGTNRLLVPPVKRSTVGSRAVRTA